MSTTLTPDSPPRAPTPAEALTHELTQLALRVDRIRRDQGNSPRETLDADIEKALALTDAMLAVHRPVHHHRVVHAAYLVARAVNTLEPPPEPEDPDEPDYHTEQRRQAIFGLKDRLDRTIRAAHRAYNGIAPLGTHRATVERAAVADAIDRLDAFQAAVVKLRDEQDTAPHFVQQGRLVTFYLKEMTFEIDASRWFLTVDNTSLDLSALVNTIEAVRDVSDRFRANVLAWFERLTVELVKDTLNLTAPLSRLVRIVRALGGLIGASEADAPDMVLIPRGRFLMGIPLEESKRFETEGLDTDAQPQREVAIRRPFLLGRTPVTVAEYETFVQDKNHPWKKPDVSTFPRHPATNVGFADAMAYIAWLSERTGETYRLPSEAEWEYACRAGTTTARWWGDEVEIDHEKGNFRIPGMTEVDAYKPNPWGLQDMLGNVLEWVADTYHFDLAKAPRDGTAWIEGDSDRVLRGGFWFDGRDYRAGDRGRNLEAPRSWVGFRLARTL